MRRLAVLSLVLLSSSALAQNLTIGSVAGVEATVNIGQVAIDMSHPAATRGTITSASLRWGGGPGCSSSVKLKIVRFSFINGTFTVVADLGPFTVNPGANRFDVPPTDVLPGDLVATVVPGGACAGISSTAAHDGEFVLTSSSDFSTGRPMNQFNVYRDIRPLVQLTDDPNVLAGVVPAAGALTGGFGSFFRTELQLTNTTKSVTTGKIVFHPRDTTGRTTDPTRTFTIAPSTTQTHPDIVTELGLSETLGSIDVIVTNGGPPPVVTSRIFNDRGSNGTNGFYEPFVTPNEALHANDAASFTLPSDSANFRVNVGVRTLTATTFSVSYVDAAGTPIGATLFKSYAANWFEQKSIFDFLNQPEVVSSGQVLVRVITGDVIVYASTTDNRTNDTSATFLKPQS